MKKFNTLEELREALMSEEGAVYINYSGGRFRIKKGWLERYCNRDNTWLDVSTEYNHRFIFNLKGWARYEKPKKIIKESFGGFVSGEAFRALKNNDCCLPAFSVKQGPHFRHKATITIEREVEE